MDRPFVMNPADFPVDRVIMPRDAGDFVGYTDAAYVTALPIEFVREQQMVHIGLNTEEGEEWADTDDLPPDVSVIDEEEFINRYCED